MKTVDDYLKTHRGQKLLKTYSTDTYGTWLVFGEDPNADFHGSHHEPLLGIVQGKLGDVLDNAVRHQRFWQWGAGGRIEQTRIGTPDSLDSTEAIKKIALAKLTPREKEVLGLK